MPRSPFRVFVFSILLAQLGAASFFAPAHAQQSGTWLNDADGVWSSGGNWVGGLRGEGAGNTAAFILNNTADRIITLDGSFTIGNLDFNDSGPANTDTAWTLAGAPTNILTLSTLIGTPTITVTSNIAQTSATISALLSGTQGLVKAGPGRLILTGTNTLSGGLTIAGGVLRGEFYSLPTGNWTIGGGGVYESNGTFSRNLGAGSDELQFNGSGGFSAAGGTLSVTLNGGNQLVWGSTPGFSAVNILQFGAPLATGRVARGHAERRCAACLGHDDEFRSHSKRAHPRRLVRRRPRRADEQH